jgi:4a-hydroxytetrahydrobiopterin dehydratase
MKLSSEQIADRLREASAWKLSDSALTREFTFPTFPDAIAFVVRLAFAAEEADHHPDLQISYRKVTVRWSTHSEGGVTEKDFAGLRQADAAANVPRSSGPAA